MNGERLSNSEQMISDCYYTWPKRVVGLGRDGELSGRVSHGNEDHQYQRPGCPIVNVRPVPEGHPAVIHISTGRLLVSYRTISMSRCRWYDETASTASYQTVGDKT